MGNPWKFLINMEVLKWEKHVCNKGRRPIAMSMFDGGDRPAETSWISCGVR